MKKNIGIIVIIIILLGTVALTLLIMNNNESNSSKKYSTSEFKVALEKLKQDNYNVELVYYIESPEIEDIHHKFIEYDYNGKIEKYYYGTEDSKFVGYYNDYQGMKKYDIVGNNFTTNDFNYLSHKDMLVYLLKDSKVKNESNRYYCRLDKDKVKTYLEELNKHDSNSLKYNNSVTYEADISIKDSTILSIIIREKDSDKDVVYKFSKFGEIETILLPNNIVENK